MSNLSPSVEETPLVSDPALRGPVTELPGHFGNILPESSYPAPEQTESNVGADPNAQDPDDVPARNVSDEHAQLASSGQNAPALNRDMARDGIAAGSGFGKNDELVADASRGSSKPTVPVSGSGFSPHDALVDSNSGSGFSAHDIPVSESGSGFSSSDQLAETPAPNFASLRSFKFKPPPAARSAPLEVATGLARGVLGTGPEMVGKGLQFLSEQPGTDADAMLGAEGMADQAPAPLPGSYHHMSLSKLITGETPPEPAHPDAFDRAIDSGKLGGNFLWELGTSLRNVGEMYAGSNALRAKPDGHDWITNALAGGAEAVGSMAAPTLLGYVPGLEGPALDASISALTGAMFGASQAQDTYEKALKAGKSPTEAIKAGWETGAATTATWTVGMGALSRAMGIAGRMIAGTAGTDAIDGVFEAWSNPRVLKSFATNFIGGTAALGATAAGGAAANAAIEQAHGLPTPTPWAAAKEAGTQALAMGPLLGPFAAMRYARLGRMQTLVARTLENDHAPAHLREQAAQQVQASLHEVDAGFAQRWGQYAQHRIDAGKSVVLDRLAVLTHTATPHEVERTPSAATTAPRALPPPAAMPSLPAPKQEMVVGPDGVARPMSADEFSEADFRRRAQSEVNRYQAKELGNTSPGAVRTELPDAARTTAQALPPIDLSKIASEVPREELQQQLDAIWNHRQAQIEAQKDAELSNVRRQALADQADQAIALSHANEFEEPRQTAIGAALGRAGVEPTDFSSPEVSARQAAAERILGTHPADISDGVLQMLARGNGSARAIARAELDRRTAVRQIGPESSDQAIAKKLAAKQPLEPAEIRRAMELGWGSRRSNGKWSYTKAGLRAVQATQNGDPLPSMGSRAVRGETGAQTPLASRAQRPMWRSALAERIDDKGPERASGGAWRAFLTGLRQHGVKSDEIAWSGIDDWLKLRGGEKVSKQQIADYLANNGVRVNEVEPDGKRYAKHTLPGAQNYGELLLTLPRGDEVPFHGTHYEQPNVLAHVRFDDRTDTDGKRTLFLEEIQSDWGQRLRSDREAEVPYHLTVPGGPFVGKTEAWVSLTLKRMIRYAVDHGYDKVAWTTGDEQAARYRQGETTAKEAQAHGMRSFYDEILRNVANDVLRKLGGGRVSRVEIEVNGHNEAVHGFDITPRLRAEAERGLPMFSRRERLGSDEEMPRAPERESRGKLYQLADWDTSDYIPTPDGALRQIRRFGDNVSEMADELLREIAKKESNSWAVAAKAELRRRMQLRRGKRTESDREIAQKLLGNQHLSHPEMRRAVELGLVRDTEEGRLDWTGKAVRLAPENSDALKIAFQNMAYYGGLRLVEPDEVPTSSGALAGEEIAKALGRHIVWFSGEAGPHVRLNGFQSPLDPKTLFINAEQPARAWLAVIGHELLHSLRATNEAIYSELAHRIVPLMKNVPEYRAWLAKALEHEGQRLTDAELDDLTHEELAADFLGDHMMNPKFWREVFREQPRSWVEKIRDAVLAAVDALRTKLAIGAKRGFGTERFIKDADAVRHAMANAFNAWAKAEGSGEPEQTTRQPLTEEAVSAAREPNATPRLSRAPRFDRNWEREARKALAAAKGNEVRAAQIVGDKAAEKLSPQTRAAAIREIAPELKHSAPDWLRHMPPETREALRKAGIWSPAKSIRERFDELKQDAGLRILQGTLDQFAPVLKRIGEYPYKLLRMASSYDAGLEAALYRGRLKLNSAGALELQLGTKGLLEAFKPLRGEVERFLAWVAGHRAESLKAEDREHLFGDLDIAQLKGLNGKLDVRDNFPDGHPGEERAKVYAAVQKEFSAFGHAILDVAEQAGLINGETRSTWEREFYVPFFRESEDTKATHPGNVSGMVRQYAFKELKGAKGVLRDLFANTIQNWSHLLQASLKNRAATETLEQAEKLGIAHQTAQPEKNAVYVLKNGAKVHYVVDDPLVLDSISALSATPFRGIAMKALGAAKHALTVGTTMSPVFRIRHTIREQITALAANETTYNFAKNWIDGLKYSSRDNPDYWRALAGGAFFRFGYQLEGDRGGNIKKLLKAHIDPRTVLTTPQQTKAMWDHAWEWWREVGERSDSITRANIYRQTYERMLAEGKSPDEAHFEAAYAAKDTLDYGLRGTWPAIRMLTQATPFMGARLQGLYKLGRGAAEMPKRFAAVVGGVTLATIALSLAYRNDKEMQSLPEWERDNYWMFRVGDTLYRIPKPFELGALATIVDRATEVALNGFDPEDRERFVSRLIPIVTSQLNLNPIPQLVFPMLEVWANKDEFTGRPIESERDRNLPVAQRYGPHTSVPARILGKGGILSPEQIDWLVNAYFGWVGAHAVATADLALRPALGYPENPERRIDDYFVVGDFARQLPAEQSRFVEQFYQHLKAVQMTFQGLREEQAQGDYRAAAETMKDQRVNLRLRFLYARVDRDLREINSRILAVRESTRIEPGEKRYELDELYVQRNELARRAEDMRAQALEGR